MGNSFSFQAPVKYGPGINKTFSFLGYPTSYIQVNELGLNQCLTNKTDQNSINSCINQNIFAPAANNSLSGVNVWMGEQLPPNPACTFTHNKPQPTIVFAPKLSPEVNTFYNNALNNNTQNFQNLEGFEMSSLLSQNNLTLIILIIITLLIVSMK